MTPRRGSLPARNIYILADSELSAEFSEVDERFLAWTSADLDVRLVDALRSRCAWHGPGFATVILTRRLESLGLPLNDEVITALAAHEMAHWFEHEAWLRASEAERGAALLRGMNDRCRKAERCAHGPAFVRACVHVAHRLMRFGWTGNVGFIPFAGEFYGMGDKSAYWQSLFVEAERFDDEPLVRTLRRPMPREARELWQEDFEASILRILEREEAAT